jgi:hypothetical protein
VVLPASHGVSRVPWYSGSILKILLFTYRAITFYGRPFQTSSVKQPLRLWTVRNPQSKRLGLGSSPFARRYLGNRWFFLFLRVLRCFSSPGLSSYTYLFSIRYLRFLKWVSPFGYLRIRAYLRLPVAFRSLSRPSSTLGAMASTMRSNSLDLKRALGTS